MIQNMKLSTKKIAVAGMLGAFSIVLSMTPIGYIPIPRLGIEATTMHIPVIVGAILGGPMVGTMVGLIFGVNSFLRPGSPFFTDPLVAIFPRLFIGIISYLSYKVSGRPVVASITGTLTNTVGVLSMIYLRGYLPFSAVAGVAVLNGTAEAIISSVVVYAIMKGLKGYKID